MLRRFAGAFSKACPIISTPCTCLVFPSSIAGGSRKRRQALARAVSVDPQSAEACSNLGLVFFKLKRYDDARRCQEKAIALRPNFPTALTNLGNALMRLKLTEQAIEAHDRAIRLKPDYADAYCNRGMAELVLNRNEAGQSEFRSRAFASATSSGSPCRQRLW